MKHHEAFRVETRGEDTAVTWELGKRSQLFVLKGLKGYTGNVYDSHVELSFGEVDVEIDGDIITAFGGGWNVTVPHGTEAFNGFDFIVTPAGVRTSEGKVLTGATEGGLPER